MLRNQRIGLALGGGVVRGLAHLGVLSVLHREHIPIDVVAGTSAGSMVGVFVAAGWPPARLSQAAERLSWRRLARPVWPRQGLISLDGIHTWLTALLGDVDFADLEKPFAVSTMDVLTGREVILESGRVAPAVQASSSVPGAITPVQINGQFLADGGVLNNIPSSLARRLGADFVIAVDIFEPHYGRHNLGPLGYGLTALETLINRAGLGGETADCVIRPELAGATIFRFSQRDELFRRGALAAEAVLPELKRAIGM